MSAALSASRRNLRRKRPPFGWVWRGEIGGNLPRQDIRCLLPLKGIFRRQSLGGEKRGAETRTAARMVGGGMITELQLGYRCVLVTKPARPQGSCRWVKIFVIGQMDNADCREKASKSLHWFNPHADRGCWLMRLFPVSSGNP